MKSSAAAVLPGQNPIKAAECMVMQAVITTKKLEEMSCNLLRESKTRSDLPTTAPYLVTTAESILSQQVHRYQDYDVVQVGPATFEVDFLPRAAHRQATKTSTTEEEDAAAPALEEEEQENNGIVVDSSVKDSAFFPPIPLFKRTRS